MQKIRESKVISYAIYLLLIIISLCIYREVIIRYLSTDDIRVFTTLLSTSDIKKFLIRIIMDIMLGAILALPQLFISSNIKGKIQFNWILSLLVGVPALIVSLGLTYDIVYTLEWPLLINGKHLYKFFAWLANGAPRNYCSFLFGYIIALSFTKKQLD
nr:hypothetical protein [Sedimentibacter sp.]